MSSGEGAGAVSGEGVACGGEAVAECMVPGGRGAGGVTSGEVARCDEEAVARCVSGGRGDGAAMAGGGVRCGVDAGAECGGAGGRGDAAVPGAGAGCEAVAVAECVVRGGRGGVGLVSGGDVRCGVDSGAECGVESGRGVPAAVRGAGRDAGAVAECVVTEDRGEASAVSGAGGRRDAEIGATVEAVPPGTGSTAGAVEERRLAWVYLSRVVEGPCAPLSALIESVGVVEAARAVRERELPGSLRGPTRQRRGIDSAAADLETMARIGGRVVTPDDAEFRVRSPCCSRSCCELMGWYVGRVDVVLDWSGRGRGGSEGEGETPWPARSAADSGISGLPGRPSAERILPPFEIRSTRCGHTRVLRPGLPIVVHLPVAARTELGPNHRG